MMVRPGRAVETDAERVRSVAVAAAMEHLWDRFHEGHTTLPLWTRRAAVDGTPADLLHWSCNSPEEDAP